MKQMRNIPRENRLSTQCNNNDNEFHLQCEQNKALSDHSFHKTSNIVTLSRTDQPFNQCIWM